MYDLSELLQDQRAQEIYRYFCKSLRYLNNPPKKPNKKTIPELPQVAKLFIDEDKDPIAEKSKKDLSSLLRDQLTEKLFWTASKQFSYYKELRHVLPKDVANSVFKEYLIPTLRKGFSPPPLTLQTLVLELPEERIDSLYTQPFVLSSLRTNLALLLHRGDERSFLAHPFNQRLIDLFTELNSGITLHEFACMSYALEESGTHDIPLSSVLCKNARKKLKTSEQVNLSNPSGETALHVICKKASTKKDTKAVQKLLDSGADCNIQDNEGYLPIHRALVKKFTPVVMVLKSHSDPEQLIQGKTILAIAYENGDVQLTNYLINHRVALDTHYQGTTILHEFCRNSDTRLVQKFLSNNLPLEFINSADAEGNTPFQIACTQNNHKIMRVLCCAYRAHIDAKQNGHTALHEACANGNYELAEFLLKLGANPEELDSKGNDCMAILSQTGHRKLYKLFQATADDDSTVRLSSASSDSSSSQEELVMLPIGSLPPLPTDFVAELE